MRHFEKSSDYAKSLLLVFFIISFSASATHANEVLGSLSSSHLCETSLGERAGQTFTPTQDGLITSIKLNFCVTGAAMTPMGTWNLYISTPTGGVLPTVYETFNVTVASGLQTINLSTPFPVTKGTMYEFQYAPHTIVRYCGTCSSPSTYAGGNITSQGIGVPGFDRSFEITIIDKKAIPTLSQWGLIILGLFLTIFGLVALRQRILHAERVKINQLFG